MRKMRKMRKISMPGFTGEASLGKTAQHYVITPGAAPATSVGANGRVIPQLRSNSLACAMLCGGDNTCWGLCMFFTARLEL
jgi:hypothetical protein